MAKKILYKVTAYHCPKCGGATEPTKIYCDYCERELMAQKFLRERQNHMRVLIDCGKDFVNFNEILTVGALDSEPETIDCTMLEDTKTRYITGIRQNPTFGFEIPLTDRGKELNALIDGSMHKVRYEMCYLGMEMAYEMDAFITTMVKQIRQYGVSTQLVSLDVLDMQKFDHVIPNEILEELRCKNCGAPIKSRFGACSYCGGWSEVAW